MIYPKTLFLCFILLSQYPLIGLAELEDCTFNNIKLYGKVKIVESFPDLTVKAVDAFADIRIQWVEHFPDTCGKWQSVDNFPDFTIKFVDSFPDIEITFVQSFPGID